MSDLIRHLNDENFRETIKTGVVLVDFFAAWCGPCRMLTPIMEEVSETFKDKAIIAKVDIDSEQKTAAEFQVTSIPTMILFKDGIEIDRLVGLRDKEALEEIISSNL
jgi:thioredoxin 1